MPKTKQTMLLAWVSSMSSDVCARLDFLGSPFTLCPVYTEKGRVKGIHCAWFTMSFRWEVFFHFLDNRSKFFRNSVSILLFTVRSKKKKNSKFTFWITIGQLSLNSVFRAMPAFWALNMNQLIQFTDLLSPFYMWGITGQEIGKHQTFSTVWFPLQPRVSNSLTTFYLLNIVNFL